MSAVVQLADAVPQRLFGSPFQPGQTAVAQTGTASVDLYKVYNPGTNALRQGQGIDSANGNTQKVARITLDGTTVTFSEDDYPELANLHDDGGTLTTATTLRTVVILRGVGQTYLGLLLRVQSDDTPVAGEFLTLNNSGSMELTLGDAGTAGTSLEIWMLDADEIYTDALVQYLQNEVDTGEVIVADGGTVSLTQIGQGGGS